MPSIHPFIGRRVGKRENQGDAAGGLTLGDLEQMAMQKDEYNNAILGPSTIFGSDATDGKHHPQNEQYDAESTEEESPSNTNSSQLRRSLGRINIDLSGRVMCHIVAPRNKDDTRGCDRESVSLFSLPSKQQSRHAAQSSASPKLQRTNTLERIIPHIYLGANYDLDEVWYGATRWIAKCSWGPLVSAGASLTKQNPEKELASPSNQVWDSANNIYRKVFPSSSFPSPKSSWILDMEGEQSVFDRSDSTARLRLLQSPSPSLPNANMWQQIPQQISVDYDSAKYSDDTPNTLYKRQIQYAPTITMNIKTPFLHRRLEVHSKKTWIVKEGGDEEGNYYGGDYCGGESCADRQLERIKERYREGVPRSNDCIGSTATATTAIPYGVRSLGSKLSTWLENDGWMPRKVTTDLMGNLVSVSEVGFGNTARGGKPETKTFRKPSLYGIVPPIHNTGIRLRISKKIDWTTLGVFPWSKNTVNRHGNNRSSSVFEALQSTHVRLELSGMYGSEDKCASVGFDVDPLDWSRTLKFTVGQEDVSVLGNR